MRLMQKSSSFSGKFLIISKIKVSMLPSNMTSFFKKSGEQDMLLGMYSAGSLPILSHFCKHKTLTELFEILYIEKGYYPIPLSKAIYYSQLLCATLNCEILFSDFTI